jgi:hypothetical protein
MGGVEMSRKKKSVGSRMRTISASDDGAERSEVESSDAAARGRPGRRSTEDRTQAVLQLLGGSR